MRFATRSLAFLPALAIVLSPIAAQEKKKDEKKPPDPKTIVVLPLGVKPGATEKLTIRGVNLENAKEVRFPDGTAEVKIVSKGKAAVPDKNPERVGDTQVVVEVKLSDKISENVAFTIVTPEGETKPHLLLVENTRPLVKEFEPNDGFRKPHVLKQLPAVVEGTIDKARDVDVVAFAGKKGQKLRVEVLAARHGSALDPQLQLYRGNSLQVDAPSRTTHNDPVIEIDLPIDDQYYLVLSDLHDSGSAIHAYRLQIDLK
jgi:hypothetical protein